MRRLFFIIILLIGFFVVIDHVSAACTTVNGYPSSCSGSCPSGQSCKNIGYYNCACITNPTNTPSAPTGGFATATPKLTPGSSCTTSDQCTSICDGYPNPAGCSATCSGNPKKCFVTYDPGEPTPPSGACPPGDWGPWGDCIGGYQTRYCETRSQFEISICGPTDGPPPGQGNTNTPVPATNTPAPPTATPTPTPGPWVKLRDSSFVSRSGINNRIPVAPVAYDADDVAQAYFVVNEAGVVAAPAVNMTSPNPSAQTGNPEYRAAYTPATYAMTATNFSGYIKARKTHNSITSLSEIDQSGIYIYTGASPLNLASVPSQFNSYDVVLITTATVNISTASFNPTQSVAILASTISFANTVTQANGLFIADTITTGSTVNQGLKINGNLIAQTSFTNPRMWVNPNIPSLFIVFDPGVYLDLLPYLSTANYEWRQLQ